MVSKKLLSELQIRGTFQTDKIRPVKNARELMRFLEKPRYKFAVCCVRGRQMKKLSTVKDRIILVPYIKRIYLLPPKRK